MVDVAQSVRAPGCGPGGRGFKSPHSPHIMSRAIVARDSLFHFLTFSMQTPSSTIRVSIIITTKNEEQNIGACIDALEKQTIPREQCEILLIDNHSEDATIEIATPRVDAVYTIGPERSAQRNEGVARARAPYILYLDADMRLSPDVVQQCLDAVEADPCISGIYIPEIVVGTGYWIAVRNFERSFYDATCIDAVRFIKRDIFLSVGGFDMTLCGPEDWDLDRRLEEKGPLHLISAPLYHDEGAFHLKQYLKKKAYYAASFDAYIQKWNNDAIVRKQLGFWYRFIGVYIENGKWKKLLRHPLRAWGMYFLRFLVGVTFLIRRFCSSTSHPYTAGRAHE